MVRIAESGLSKLNADVSYTRYVMQKSEFFDIVIPDPADFTPGWIKQALCRNNPDFSVKDFFSFNVHPATGEMKRGRPSTEAISKLSALCDTCPVQAECASDSIHWRDFDGWNGVAPKWRREYLTQFGYPAHNSECDCMFYQQDRSDF